MITVADILSLVGVAVFVAAMIGMIKGLEKV